MTKHSPLGASGAERWMECPGSVRLLSHLQLPESDEADWTREGTAGHEAAAHCLNTGQDAWELVGREFYGTSITAGMSNAVQVYVDECRQYTGEGWTSYVEYGISSPAHKDFYGTLDFGALPPKMEWGVRVRDLKMGMGIVVEIEDNPQLKYYAFGLIDGLERETGLLFEDTTPVNLGIVQPRVEWREPVRTWDTTVGEVKAWVNNTLVPAMVQTEVDDGLNAGPWCRFCPAKLVCPLLTALFKAAATHNPKHLVNLSDEALGLNFQYLAAVKHYATALENEAYRRRNAGRDVPGSKLVYALSHRQWASAESKRLAAERFGPAAMTEPELKSPAEIDKLPGGKEFTKAHAFHPKTKLTIVPLTDRREEVTVKPAAEEYEGAIAALAGREE